MTGSACKSAVWLPGQKLAGFTTAPLSSVCTTCVVFVAAAAVSAKAASNPNLSTFMFLCSCS